MTNTQDDEITEAKAIRASALLSNHLSLLQSELGRQMEAAVRSEAEIRGISLDDYAFDTMEMSFALRRERATPSRERT